MEKRSNINKEFAYYLKENIASIKLKSLVHFSDMNHIIIGRWYYSAYLLAKSKLGIMEETYIPHISKSSKDRLTIHYGVWDMAAYRAMRLFGDYVLSNSLLEKGERLHSMRDFYEYRGCECSNKQLLVAERLFMEVYDGLQKL